jgi:hypothetical protein
MHDLTGRQFGKLTFTGPTGEDLLLPGGRRLLAGPLRLRPGMIAPAKAYLARRLESCGRPTPEQRAELEQTLAAT